MIAKLKKIFKNNKVEPALSIIHKETSHLFALKYHDLEMGNLKFLDNQWLCEYSELFKKQTEITPLIDFPDIDKIYKSEALWPFFSNRIPSLRQPKIQEYISKHPLESKDTVKLLTVFGEYSVNNPFRLQLK